jgi:hypothetical protein
MSTTQEASQFRHGTDLADQLVQASGAHAADRIAIAGGRHIELLLQLFSRGFTHVACHSANQECPHDADSVADILLIPDCADEAELRAVLARLGPVLRAGGTIVLHGGGDRRATTRLRALLADNDYLPVSWTAQPDDLLLCARKRSPVPHARAA